MTQISTSVPDFSKLESVELVIKDYAEAKEFQKYMWDLVSDANVPTFLGKPIVSWNCRYSDLNTETGVAKVATFKIRFIERDFYE